MRVVAVEEHVGSFDLVSRIPPPAIARRGWPRPDQLPSEYGRYARDLAHTAAERAAEMDSDGIDVQVLSVAGPGAELLPPDAAPGFAKAYNEHLAGIVRASPRRFAGLAHLPMTAPEAAADELERAVNEMGFSGAMVNGTTDEVFLDDPRYDRLLERAARLGCPLYLHPAPPPEPVRRAYYDNLPNASGQLLSLGGWGWHYETALHVVRLVLAGSFDRHPGLNVIVGHMGEGLPTMLARLDDVMSSATSGHLTRSVSETIVDQVWITTSGFYTLPPFLAALTTFGADRIMFAVDSPYSPGRPQVDFLRALPVSEADRRKIAHENADRLLRLSVTDAAASQSPSRLEN